MDLTVFLILAPFGVVVQIFVLTKTWQYRREKDGRLLLWLIASGIGWLFFNTLEVLAPSETSKLLFTQVTFLFVAAVPVLVIIFALRLVDTRDRLSPAHTSLLWILYLLDAAFVLTAPQHDLFFRDFRFVAEGPYLRMDVEYGPWFYIHSAFSFALILAAAFLMVWVYPRAHHLFRQQTKWVAIGVSLTLITSILYVMDILPWEKDFSPIVYSIATWACARGMVRYRLFDLRPIARDALVDSMQEGMVVLNKRDEIVDINPAARQFIEIQDVSCVGRPIAEVLPRDQVRAFRHLQHCIQAHTEVVIPVHGVPHVFDVRISPLKHNRGFGSGRLVLLHDITKRRHAEEELRLANETLKTRNEELNAFAHTVAHDLRSPLQSILGFADILKDEGERIPFELRSECVNTIVDSGRRMNRIIEALLLLSVVREQQVEPAPIDVLAVAEEVKTNLAPMIRERGAVVIVSATHCLEALGYIPWIEVVWMNYLTNALKYGGHQPRIEIGATPQGDGHVRFWVRDSGPGLSHDQQVQLFTPFTRMHHNEIEGHGLGLSIVRRIMERLQGTCGVESTGIPGQGSTFYFTLPEAPVPVTTIMGNVTEI